MKKIIFLLAIICMMITSCSFKKEYVIGVVEDYPPYVYSIGDKYYGLDVDLIDEIAKTRKFEYKIKKFDKAQLESAFDKGKIDAVFFVQGMEDKVKYTNDYLDQEYAVGSLGTKNNIDDIRGKNIGILSNSTVRQYLNDIRGDYGFAIITYKDSNSIEKAIQNGDIDYIVDDYRFLLHLKQRLKKLNIGERKSDGISLKIAVNKNKDEFLNEFNTGLIDIINSNKYKEIVDRYK